MKKILFFLFAAVLAAGGVEAQEAAAMLNEFTLKSHKVLNEAAVNIKRVSEKKMPAMAIAINRH